MSGLLREAGVNPETIKAGRNADAMSALNGEPPPLRLRGTWAASLGAAATLVLVAAATQGGGLPHGPCLAPASHVALLKSIPR